MWAKNEILQKAGQEAALALKPPRRLHKPEPNRVLRCQLVLCIIMAAAVLLGQKFAPARLEKCKAEARTLLESPLAGQEEIVRFAQAAGQAVRERLQTELSAAPEAQAAAGIGLKSKKAPEGCSLKHLEPGKTLGSPLQSYTETSGYGWRRAPQNGFHTGVDLAAAQGTAVYPVLSGYVRAAGWNKSYGNYLRILHENGVESLYAHLQYLFVSEGAFVQQTTCLGTVGQTGNATGPHLHLELLQNDIRYDPAGALPQ